MPYSLIPYKGAGRLAALVMLPGYIILTAYIGFIYLFDPGDRLQYNHSIEFVRSIEPMPVWGAGFLGLALLMLAAAATSRTRLFALALFACCGSSLLWAIGYVVSIFQEPRAQLNGPALFLFVAVACYASARALMAAEPVARER